MRILNLFLPIHMNTNEDSGLVDYITIDSSIFCGYIADITCQHCETHPVDGQDEGENIDDAIDVEHQDTTLVDPTQFSAQPAQN